MNDSGRRPRIGAIVLICCIPGLLFACNERSADSDMSDQTIRRYASLYEVVFHRDDAQLLSFTNDSLQVVRRQAWRALAQTPIDSLSSFINKVEHEGSNTAWFALSLHKLDSTQIRALEQRWVAHPNDRTGISLVLGQQGDAKTLHFLQQHIDSITGRDYEPDAAVAVGRLMTRFSYDDTLARAVIDTAFASDDSKIAQSWLYGFYRGNKDKLTKEMKEYLRKKWEAGHSVDVDQYAAGILGASVFSKIVEKYTSTDKLNDDVQLGIELAKLIPDVKISDSTRSKIKALLQHPNLHVKRQALAGLSGRLKPSDSLFAFIRAQILDKESAEPSVWLQALQTAVETDSTVIKKYADRLQNIADENPYLLPPVMEIRLQTESDTTFINNITEMINEGDPLKSMYAVNALYDFWVDSKSKKQWKSRVRELTWKALALRDRGEAYAAEPLLEDSLLFSKDDFKDINSNLNSFQLPGDIEVYQTFGALYKKRFEVQAKPVIDSLAALNYAPLNRSLRQSGWDVPAPKKAAPHFRLPGWDRLQTLGAHPVWVLETEKGTIKVKMNTLSAPATVSAIDSLTRAGAYNGVPFHRVVPNFVIQGGDIERQDGFGGPDFVIPTEPSENGFVRGAAGIASAGPDTEGSQYFFMLQSAPHLDSHYTLFGNVIEGMDVVDRIVVGDNVKRAYWE